MLISPLNALPWTISSVINAMTSLRRIKSFLSQEQMTTESPATNQTSEDHGDHLIVMKADAVTWPAVVHDEDEKTRFFKLKKINLMIKPGTLNMVVGNVSAGKTALLNSIVNEMKVLGTGGTHYIKDNCNIAYVPQNPWLQKGSIRVSFSCTSCP